MRAIKSGGQNCRVIKLENGDKEREQQHILCLRMRQVPQEKSADETVMVIKRHQESDQRLRVTVLSKMRGE